MLNVNVLEKLLDTNAIIDDVVTLVGSTLDYCHNLKK